jgi:hypothetical protein
MTKMQEDTTAKSELSLDELDAATGGKFSYFEMNGDTYATNGTGKPVQVTKNWSGPLGWLLN